MKGRPQVGVVKSLTQPGSLLSKSSIIFAGASGEDLGIYGLGNVRTFEQYIAFSGVDPPNKIASSGDQCGDLDWVPYDHEVDSIGLFHT